MRLFNSLTQQYEAFEPQGESVSLCVCGVTPYDTAHLGHAFVYATFDVLVRFLRFRGFSVRYVQNVTDIDDALFARVREVGDIAWDGLARRETERFVRAMQAINISMPEHLVPASDQLPAMIALITQLLDNGFAYMSDGWAYFSIRRDPAFGRLAYTAGLLEYAQLLAVANQNGNEPDDPRKHDPLDFVLWRRSAPDEPSWPSPWGAGRPGWHIRVLCHRDHLSGHAPRHLWWRSRPHLSPPQLRDCAVGTHGCGASVGALLDACGLGTVRRYQDEQVAGKPDQRAQPPAHVLA